MIRHDAIRQNPYRHPLARLGQETHKARVVWIILEDTGTRIGPIEYVKNDLDLTLFITPSPTAAA